MGWVSLTNRPRCVVCRTQAACLEDPKKSQGSGQHASNRQWKRASRITAVENAGLAFDTMLESYGTQLHATPSNDMGPSLARLRYLGHSTIHFEDNRGRARQAGLTFDQDRALGAGLAFNGRQDAR